MRLDPKMAADVMKVIDDLADDVQLQVAMVIVSHDIPAVKRIADVVHLLSKGKVIYSGPAAEAFAPGGPASAAGLAKTLPLAFGSRLT